MLLLRKTPRWNGMGCWMAWICILVCFSLGRGAFLFYLALLTDVEGTRKMVTARLDCEMAMELGRRECTCICNLSRARARARLENARWFVKA